ncbi:MAG: sigma-70 family RNA polymerase sigma factor [Planctomycetes bacterium]|nr:sigma-70 family RNA polymerase sigma factor [Planctomycetota bacterium]
MTDWDDVVSRHGQVVWQTAWRMLGNHADALDCYQTAFLDAFQVAGRESVRDWPALLRRLATARALDLLRSRYRKTSRGEPLADPSSVVSPHAGPEQQAEADDLLERLLAELTDRQANVFCLVALEGMTYRQVADQMKLNTSAVSKLLSRARKRLRERLASVEPELGRRD